LLINVIVQYLNVTDIGVAIFLVKTNSISFQKT